LGVFNEVFDLGQTGALRRIFSPDLPGVYYELVFVGFSIMAGMSLSSSFLSILANDLDPSGVLVGLVVSAWFLSRIFMELPAGIISDRVGRRRLLVTGLGLSLVGPLLCSQAGNVYVLIVGRAIWGMGTALYFMSNMALLMDILPQSTRGRALGAFQGIEFLGSFVGAPIGAFLASYMSYTRVFYFTFLFTLFSFVVAMRSEGIMGLESGGGSKPRLTLRQVSRSLRDWGIIAVCFSTLLRTLVVQGVFQTVLQLFLNQQVGLTVAGIGWVVSMKVLGQVLSILVAGVLSDRFGRKPVLVVGFVVSGVSVFMFTVSESLLFLLLSGFVSGVGEGLNMTTILALLTDIAPLEARGGAVGLYRTFMDVGGFLGPIVFMLAYNGYGVRTPFYLGAALCLLNTVFILVAPTRRVA
jgi:DHA1 family multidrug resistance protein-like MFS transporter